MWEGGGVKIQDAWSPGLYARIAANARQQTARISLLFDCDGEAWKGSVTLGWIDVLCCRSGYP